MCNFAKTLLLVVLLAGCASTNHDIAIPQSAQPAKTTQKLNAPFYGKFGGKSVEIKESKRTLPMRGVWVATVKNLDIHRHHDAANYNKEIKAIFDSVSQHGANAVFFQVRSWNDAMYPSKLNPWSRWLTGKEGVAIEGLDPLAVALTEARRHKVQFHAWLNPYRVCEAPASISKEKAIVKLSKDNFARKHPEYVISVSANGQQLLILDPGYPQVRKHIVDSVKEILNVYAVDGIHLDDYFYPYSQIGNLDSKSAALHNKGKMPIDDWRRNNIDLLIKDLSDAVHAAAKRQKRRIVFGVSPFGIWANRKHNQDGSQTEGLESYYRLYADSRKWVRLGWVDYIAPQLYWSFDYQAAAFAGLVEWWCRQVEGTNVELYIGMALYQAAPSGKWHETGEIQKQLAFIKQFPQVKGAIMFRSSFLSYLANW